MFGDFKVKISMETYASLSLTISTYLGFKNLHLTCFFLIFFQCFSQKIYMLEIKDYSAKNMIYNKN